MVNKRTNDRRKTQFRECGDLGPVDYLGVKGNGDYL